MKKKNCSTLALSAALLALMLMTAACNDNGTLSNATSSSSPTTSASPSPSGSGEVAPEESNEASNPESEVQEATGEYVGLIDSHSIEVKMEDGPVAFQVSPELAEQLDPWESNIPVKFRYTQQKIDVNGEQVVQYTIISIDKQ